MSHNGRYHGARAIIRESSANPENFVVVLPDGHPEYGYAEDSSFYVGMDSLAVEEGYLTVDSPTSDLIKLGVEVTKPNTQVAETLYIVHSLCGEAFDDTSIAHEHMTKCDPSDIDANNFFILPESEAL